MNNELTANDAVGLRVATALETARLPKLPHLFLEARDDRVDVSFLLGQKFLLGDSQTFVRSIAIDQLGRQARDAIAQERVESRPKPGIDPAFEMEE